MPTTSSPWASPSSPAGRRLLLTEPATLDAVPVLDDATFAALEREVCASVDGCGRQSHKARARTARRPALLAAAVLVAVLGIAVPVLRSPAAEPAAASVASSTGSALARAAGTAVGRLDPMPPVPTTAADGEVVVALVDPTDALGATPLAATPSLPARLGTLVELATLDAAGG